MSVKEACAVGAAVVALVGTTSAQQMLHGERPAAVKGRPK